MNITRIAVRTAAALLVTGALALTGAGAAAVAPQLILGPAS